MKCPHSFVIRAPGEQEVYSHLEYGHAHAILQGVVVPCGKCIVCRRNKASEWAVRLRHELEYSKTACFITLTYSDMEIPLTSNKGLATLYKKDVQLFMKRLRKNTGGKIKYFLCGEYGSRTKRPHYHAIIFGWRPEGNDLVQVGKNTERYLYTSEKLKDIWKKGNVQVGSVTTKSVYYVTGYLIKKMPRVDLDGRIPEFILCSQGLGLQYANENPDKVKKAELTLDGKQIPVPKYYIKKIGIDRTVVQPRLVDLQVKIAQLKKLKGRLLQKSVAKSRRIAENQLKALNDISQRSKGYKDI